MKYKTLNLSDVRFDITQFGLMLKEWIEKTDFSPNYGTKKDVLTQLADKFIKKPDEIPMREIHEYLIWSTTQ